MEKYLPVMSSDYRRKHYPRGVFAAISKKTAKLSFGIYIFFGIVLLGSGCGVYWSLGKVTEYRLTGQDDYISTGYAIMVFFAFFAVLALACILLTIVRHARGAEKWKKICAGSAGYTVSDMNEFDRQTMNTECRAVKLLSKASAMANGQSDGILTQDYVYLADSGHSILKLSDLSAACLVSQTVRVGGVTSNKKYDFLTVILLSKNGNRALAQCTPESGSELIAFLKERVPDIYTADGRIISREDFDKLG